MSLKSFTAWIAALALAIPGLSFAQSTVQTTIKVVGTCGTAVYTSGKMAFPTQDTTGVLCTSVTGGGGGVAGFTAAASPTAVAAGTNKPAVIDTASSALFIEPVKPGTTTTIDLSAPSGVLGSDGSTIATTANPFPTVTACVGPTSSATKTSTCLMGVSDGTNQQPIVAPIGLGDGVNGNNSVSNGNFVFNGTSWDRQRGSTSGIYVATNNAATGIIQATASAAISSTAAGGPTQLIAASGSTKIYVTNYQIIASGAGTFAWVTGTGTNCGTGTAYLTGSSGHPMSFAANGGISNGGGLGPIMITGAGGELCYITTGAVDISGSVAYAQF